jgi:hypothetical protein
MLLIMTSFMVGLFSHKMKFLGLDVSVSEWCPVSIFMNAVII